jgi:plastocyanin
MRTTYFTVPVAVALILSATHYLNAQSAVKAAELTASTDTTAGSELSGKVVVRGQPSRNHSIIMAADPECLKLHSGPAMSEEIVTGPENALANVVVYISEGLGSGSFDPPKQPVVIEQKGCQYYPHVVALEAGQKLEVRNDDATTHNIHPLPLNNREWNQSQAQGVPPFEATFGREEVSIPVKCNIHPWMKGYIAVFKHPYFAVTGKDGRFVLKGLPAGNYTITAWHEKLGTLAQKAAINSHEAKQMDFVFEVSGRN